MFCYYIAVNDFCANDIVLSVRAVAFVHDICAVSINFTAILSIQALSSVRIISIDCVVRLGMITYVVRSKIAFLDDDIIREVPLYTVHIVHAIFLFSMPAQSALYVSSQLSSPLSPPSTLFVTHFRLKL